MRFTYSGDDYVDKSPDLPEGWAITYKYEIIDGKRVLNITLDCDFENSLDDREFLALYYKDLADNEFEVFNVAMVDYNFKRVYVVLEFETVE